MNLSPKNRNEFLDLLKQRFETHKDRHPNMEWKEIQSRLLANPQKLGSLYEMEKTSGEPDVVGYDELSNEFVFFDCSDESPKGRRSLCYDRKALEARKANKPKNAATDVAIAMGIEMLTEDQYRDLQKLGNFDTKTSSWIKTPIEIRKLGGAIFGDLRFGRVFVYHNGVESYYAGRGFRGCLRV